MVLVGKGITFDTGGLSLKPPAGMVGMKFDMAGAATVLAVVRAAAALALPVRVSGWLCLAENMPSGRALRPGDVVRIADGTSVEVPNTDAEGRVVMADGLVAASRTRPDVLIDVATLTGAIIVALGNRHTGVMGDDTTVAAYLAAAERVGDRHAVLLSIVGIDRIPHGYYAGKLAQEEEYSRASVPVSIIRATQFHEFAGQVAAQARVGPLQLAPRARVQPIAADAVASHLVSLAEGDPQGRSTDIAGPQEEQLSRMVREWERHAGHRRPVLPVDIPSAQMRGMRRGLALPGPDALILGPRFADWLSRR